MARMLDVVRGRRIDRVAGEFIGAWARGFERTIIDLGTGDGRWLYRQARRHPQWAFVGVDANAQGMREVSFRTGRKPVRGGIPNLLFVRAAIDELPQALNGVADEIYILYPWGSLLDVVWTPRSEALSAIACLDRPGGRVEVHVNASAVAGGSANMASLMSGYAAGGIRLDDVAVAAAPLHSSWAKRIARDRGGRVYVLKGTVAG